MLKKPGDWLETLDSLTALAMRPWPSSRYWPRSPRASAPVLVRTELPFPCVRDNEDDQRPGSSSFDWFGGRRRWISV